MGSVTLHTSNTPQVILVWSVSLVTHSGIHTVPIINVNVQVLTRCLFLTFWIFLEKLELILFYFCCQILPLFIHLFLFPFSRTSCSPLNLLLPPVDSLSLRRAIWPSQRWSVRTEATTAVRLWTSLAVWSPKPCWRLQTVRWTLDTDRALVNAKTLVCIHFLIFVTIFWESYSQKVLFFHFIILFYFDCNILIAQFCTVNALLITLLTDLFVKPKWAFSIWHYKDKHWFVLHYSDFWLLVLCSHDKYFNRLIISAQYQIRGVIRQEHFVFIANFTHFKFYTLIL